MKPETTMVADTNTNTDTSKNKYKNPDPNADINADVKDGLKNGLKYERTDETAYFEIDGEAVLLYRIRALRDFANVKAGDQGGYIEKEENLSQDGDAWIYDDARVCGNARVCGSAKVFDFALVRGNAEVTGDAWVYGRASVQEHAIISGSARVCNHAKIGGHAIIDGNVKISGYTKVYGDARIGGNARISLNEDDAPHTAPLHREHPLVDALEGTTIKEHQPGNWRMRIFEIVEADEADDPVSKLYDVVMMITIIASLLPLAFKSIPTSILIVDHVTVTIFIIDYALRLMTADLKLKKAKKSFALYPVTPMAIIDLLSILPSLTPLAMGFKLLRLDRIVRVIRALRVFRAFKIFRYSKSLSIIGKVILSQKSAFIAVCTIAIAYIFIAALIVFNVEPDTFNNFFDAIYWALISLTTMGYGDIYPVTNIGRIVTMISAFLGIAIVALPAGIITAGYMEELDKMDPD